MAVAGHLKRSGHPPAVGACGPRGRPESRDEGVEVAGISRSLTRVGLGRDELVHRDDARRRADVSTLDERASKRGKQLVPQRSERRVVVQRRAEERSRKAVEALGSASAGGAAAGGGAVLREVEIERLVRLGLEPDHEAAGVHAADEQKVVLPRTAWDVVEPRLAFGDPALQPEAGEFLADLEDGRQALGAIALLLTVLGTYVLGESMAAMRMREMGIRGALGATRRQLGAIVIAETGRLVGLGLLAGLGLAAMGASTIRAFLFQIQPFDPLTLVVVAGLILTLSLLVSLRPALRAANVDLACVLRDS